MAEEKVITLGANDLNKFSDICSLTMKSKSFFNIFGSIVLSIWIFDFRALNYITLFFSRLTSYSRAFGKQFIIVANGDHVLITIDDKTKIKEKTSSHQATSETWAASQIWLHHKCLGHPPLESIESGNCVVCQTYLMKHKSKLDNDIEYVNLEFAKFVTDQGIIHELTYGEVVLIATYLINRLPTHVLQGISPVEHVLSFFPSFSLIVESPMLCVWVCCFFHSHSPIALQQESILEVELVLGSLSKAHYLFYFCKISKTPILKYENTRRSQ
ncbi:hypothetical protein CR513_27606, partial [Mucuna pruriens]